MEFDDLCDVLVFYIQVTDLTTNNPLQAGNINILWVIWLVATSTTNRERSCLNNIIRFTSHSPCSDVEPQSIAPDLYLFDTNRYTFHEQLS